MTDAKNQRVCDLSDRLLNFAANVIRFIPKIESSNTGRYLANQLMRSAASSGANYEEAHGAESKADFIHKMQIVLKEIRESLFWLKLIKVTDSFDCHEITNLLSEADEISKVITKSILTARRPVKEFCI